MIIRKAIIQDTDAIVAIENLCFPKNEAATKKSITKRIETFANNFWVLEKESEIIGFINGMVTNEKTIHDKMFEDSSLHNNNGKWQSIFGVAIHPDFQQKGYASTLMKVVIEETRKNNKKGCILTCKKNLLPFYSKFGYADCGKSQSQHGGELWYDMRIEV